MKVFPEILTVVFLHFTPHSSLILWEINEIHQKDKMVLLKQVVFLYFKGRAKVWFVEDISLLIDIFLNIQIYMKGQSFW